MSTYHGICVILLILIHSAGAEIIPYQKHNFKPLQPEYLTIPKFSGDDAPHWSPGLGHSYIDLSRITLHNECHKPSVLDCKNATFDIMMFEEPKEKFWMDYWPNRQFCCTGEMITRGECFPEQINRMTVPPELAGIFPRSIHVPPMISTTFSDDGAIAHHDIKKSGVYVLLMGICDPEFDSVSISGSIDSIDPYGYLRADLFGNLPFYGGLSLLYSIVGIVWLVYCFCHSENLMPLQFWITLVLGLGMLETTVLFAQYLSWNDYGAPALAVTFIALFFGVLKRALSRVVVLFVTLGYGVVRPSLGSQMDKVLSIGAAYFFLSLYYTIIATYPSRNKNANELGYTLLSITMFLLAGVDTAFYCWVFLSINNILQGLAARKKANKYLLYKNFRNVLVVSLFANCVWLLYGSVIKLNTNVGEDRNWRDRWTVDALWEVTYFMVFVAIAILWAPSINLQQEGYFDVSQLEDDEEYQTGGVELPEVESAELPKDPDDAEYGGSLNDEDDPYNNPYKGKGALDPLMAVIKKQ